MRTVFAHLFSSVDGVVEAPHRFQFGHFGPEEADLMVSSMGEADTAVMGRKIYSEWVDHFAGSDEDFGALINPLTKYVASTTLQEPLQWEKAQLIDADLIDFVRKLKQEDGGAISVFGISVIRQLLLAGLVDKLMLTVHPASGGGGRRLFDEVDGPVRLELIDSQTSSAGNALLTYRLAEQ